MTAPISLQLYTLREQSATDFEGVLRRVGAIGYVGVELAGFNGMTPARFNEIAADTGLIVSSAHIGDTAADDLNRALDDLQAVGCNTVIMPFLPPKAFEDLAAIEQSADTINAGYEIANSRGVTYGYHNHFWEFQTVLDGRTAWSILFDGLHPGVVAELDIYWATLGGVDPRQVIADLGDRLALLHVKDGPADDPHAPMVDVGSGTLDIASILASAPTARWHIVELDRCAADADMFDLVAASHRYLVGNGLSRGRA